MAEGGGYSQHLSQTEEGEGVHQVGNPGPPAHHHHASPHHFSHTSSHSSQGSHPHPLHQVMHSSPVRSVGGGGTADALGASPSRSMPPGTTGSGPGHGPSHAAQQLPISVQAQQGTGAGSSSSTSWSNIPLAVNNGDSRHSLDDEGSTNYPTTAAEILDLLKQKTVILSGGRDRQGQSIITFPAKPKSFVYDRGEVRKVVQYLTSIPTEDIRENGFSVIVDARNSNWQNTKLILRTLQEALPAQIHVVYIIQPGQFWQKQQSSRGHNKEKSKLEFSTVKLSVVEKLIRHVESSQLTNDLGGFLPYNHDQWIKLRLDLEHFISSFNALMEHTSHVEQQLRLQHEASDPETAEEVLSRHIQLQDQLKKAPQNTIREGNELLRSLEQRDEAGTSSMTPDKINAIAIIKRLLDNIGRRQVQLNDLWRERKLVLEQILEHRVFETLIVKVRSWLKTRGEEVVATRSEIGISTEAAKAIADQHEKFEAKAKHQFNNLTQLRRMADKMSGAKHFAADTVQRQVSKLKTRYNKFETNLTERKKIVMGSVQLHNNMDEWRSQCQTSAQLLKQQVSADAAKQDSRTEHVQQLEKITMQTLADAAKLLELMEAVGQRSTDSGGRGTPNYSSGIRHVKKMVEEIEKHRTRVGKLAEAQKLQTEQFKQLHSCEKDAQEVTQWLSGMRQQLASNHGNIGDSLTAVEKLSGEHEKFSETAKKTYKYGCDLVSAAQRTRKSLDQESSSSLLTELKSVWEQLFLGIEERKDRLNQATQFHLLVNEAMSCYSKWSTPVHQLPKSPEVVEERLRDIADNKESLAEKMKECLELGSSLLDRLCRPLLPGDPSFRSLNDNTKLSLSFLREKLEEIERKSMEMGSLLPQQEAVLREFLLFCEFEHRIERILLWLQDHGLTKIQQFSHIGKNHEAVKSQVTQFQDFTEKCQENTHEVDQVVHEAPEVEAQIHSFKSDLVKKTTSLKAVWDKFLQRVENRKTVLHKTVCFYERVNKLFTLFDGLGSVLGSTKVADKAIAAYTEKRENVGKWFEEAIVEGSGLIEIFKKSSIDQGEPANRVKEEMDRLRKEKGRVDQLWLDAQQAKKAKLAEQESKARRLSEENKPVSNGVVAGAPSPATALSAQRPETEGKEASPPRMMAVEPPPPESPKQVLQVAQTRSSSVEERGKDKVKVVKAQGSVTETVSRWLTDEYAELEEEAYKNLEWLENECDGFLIGHSQFGESCDQATKLKDEHDRFVERIEPTCARTEKVLESLEKLRPQAPPLASSIDQLCQAVSERIKGRKALIRRRSSVLDMFVEFCSVYKQITADLQTLDDYLCEPMSTNVAVDVAQQVLDKYRPVMANLSENYPKAKSFGEKFLEESTEQKAGPKLAVGDACTCVAVNLGGLEGQYPDITDRWMAREKELVQNIDWQSFKVTSDHICSWLRDSAEMFLQSRVELGTSLETAEDLLMEHQEFEIRAKRTAEEVQSLLAKSEEMLSRRHFASSELNDRTFDLNSLHNNFESRLRARGNVLNDSVTFYRNADELNRDMTTAIEGCNSLTRSGQDLPTKLKIASISTRFNNLKHEGDKLLLIFVSKPVDTTPQRSPKTKVKKSDSASASELAIKQTLANLQGTFASYKKAFERRQVSFRTAHSVSPKPTDGSGTSVLLRTKSELKSPSPIETSPSHKKAMSAENHDGAVTRARAHTDTGDKGLHNAVKDKVASFNKKAQEEEQIQMPNFGITFDARPRAKTADSAVDKAKGTSPKSPRRTGQRPPSAKSEEKEKTKEEVGIKVENPSEAASVPLRRKARGLSKDERKQKIAAIRELFETSDLANIMVEPGRQWRPASLAVERRRTLDGSRPISRGTILSTTTESSSLKSASGASLSDGSKVASESVASTPKPVPEEDVQQMSETDKSRATESAPKDAGGREQATSPSVVVSPPPETRPRLQTAPAVYKTVVKDLPSTKQQVITLNFEQPKAAAAVSKPEPTKTKPSVKEQASSVNIQVGKGGSLERNLNPAGTFVRDTRATRSVSPQQRHRVGQKDQQSASQQSSPGRKRRLPLLLQVAGKVSSLRNMFDSQAAAQSKTDSLPLTRSRSNSESKSHRIKPSSPSALADSPSHQRSSSMDTNILKRSTYAMPSPVQEEPQSVSVPSPSPPPPAIQRPREVSPDIVPIVRPQPVRPTAHVHKESPLTSSIAGTSSPHPPPRPHSPVGYILENQDQSESDLESESDGSIYESDTSSLDEVDLEWVGGDDDVDLPWGLDDPDLSLTEQRMFKSLSVVLSELISSEFTYVQSLETLIETYHPMFSDEHIPTFLQGKRDTVFANLEQIYAFQRKFYSELSLQESSLEGICSTFIHHGAELKCYIPFLSNLDRGLHVLTSYGGSFFTDKQQEIGDELSLIERYSHPKQRLIDYDRYLKEIFMCSQKEYLHGVSIVKDALRVMHRLMQQVDSSIALGHLSGCDLPLDLDGIIRRDLFFVYTTQAKKHVHEMMVMLHRSHVVFARPKRKKGTENIVYEFTNSMEVSKLHMLETYKSRVDKFALCEERPSTDNLYVLQPVTRDPLMKRVWLQELRPVIQRRKQTECLVSEEDIPLPLWFQRVELRSQFSPGGVDREEEGWFGSLRRRASLKGRNSLRRGKAGSIRRNRKRRERESLKSSESFGTPAKDAPNLSNKEKREFSVRASTASSISSTSSQVPPQGLATVQLATMSKGQFQSSMISDTPEYWEVVENYESEREGLLSVRAGQLVEVLDDSGSNWMVLTIAMATGDLETEGFLPAHILRPAARSSLAGTSSHTSQVSRSTVGGGMDMTDAGATPATSKHEQFEAETGQEVLRPEEGQGRAAATQREGGMAVTAPATAPSSEEAPIVSPNQQPDTDDELAKQLCSEETTGQPSHRGKPHKLNFGLHSASQEELSNQPMSDLREIDRQLSQPQQNYGEDLRDRQGLKYRLQREPMSSSLHSLPSSFSPAATPKSPHTYLGYNPMRIPELTMSQPDLVPKIQVNSADRMQARKEVMALREATVSEISSAEELEQVDYYVAIADFEAAESTNVSLTAGQYVLVLDNSRSDWWLVRSTEESSPVGWVPANYLEKLLKVRSPSPTPEPFEDETGELQRILMKDQDLHINRRQLYKSSFLSLDDADRPQQPSQDQLEGAFSLPQAYVAVSEVKPLEPGQLALVQEQPVRVIDPLREDWWLVATIPEEEGVSPVEGWVPADKLRPFPDIREDAMMVDGRGGKRPSANPVPINAAVVSPSSRPLWVVLHDYTATEPGMLSVHEGELVEVMDISRNEWCLVQPSSRQSVEGWVPTAYLKPYDAGGYAHPSLLPPQFHPHSSPDDSDVETPERSTVFSPEMVEVADNEERKADAKKRRDMVMTELASTERDYVEKLRYCIENYIPAVEGASAPKSLKAEQSVLFGNITDIYNFHKDVLLPKLLECESSPAKLGDVFISSKEQLLMYVTYTQNKAASDNLYHEFTAFFEEVRSQLRDRLELPDYLIMPVQRITKYTLLLHDFHKSSVRSGSEVGNIAAALEVTKSISTQANNTIHLSLIEGSTIKDQELGDLILQDVFDIQEGQRPLFKGRRVFLFEQALVITKQRRDNERTYIIKEQFMLTDISMTPDMEHTKRNIIIYDMQTGTKFILRAPTTSIRNSWLEKSNQLIRKAKMEAAKTMTIRTPPTEPRRRQRPRSASARVLQSPMPVEEPPGTLYVVVECIMMEGSDVDLYPGDIVELVRMEPATGSLRVRTLDEHHPIEGVIPESYLRKKDSMLQQGGRMETAPRFTIKPNDLDLKTGNTATISCAFNGQPAPSIVWRKDGELITSDNRRKITSCGTSSVLEVTSLEHEDKGVYSCYATNQLGSDSASMTLSLHGPPSEPKKPTVSSITRTSARVRWAPPDHDGRSQILSYQVEMLQAGFTSWQAIIQQPRSSFTIRTLEPGTSYQFRVVAYNKYGASKPSEPCDPIMTRARGWLNQPARRPNAQANNMPNINVDGPTEFTDTPPLDQLSGEEGLLSPSHTSHPYIRRSSISSTYDVIPEELGRGRFGIVQRCLHKHSGLEMAAKYVRLKSKKKASIRREVEVLRKVRGKSPHIVEFHDAFERGRNLIIVMELVPDGELIGRIIADNDFTEGVAVSYLSQLLSAVDYLHQLNIAHLDIRPENILLSGGGHGNIKLIDFGSARDLTSDTSPVFTSSVEFCAPEIINQDIPTLASDMWSVGVLTYVLLSGISPFFVDNIQMVVERIKEARYSFYNEQFDQVSQEAKDFISALLQKSPEFRMTAANALLHPWIKTLVQVGENSWPMARLDVSRLKTFNARRKWHTVSVAVDDTTVFGPRSIACLSPIPPDFEEIARNEAHPQLWDGPTHLSATVGTSAIIQFQMTGRPEPTMIWEHNGEDVPNSDRVTVTTSSGVTTLSIIDLVRQDRGLYTCSAVNKLGAATAECELTVTDVPEAPTQVNGVILGSSNSALVSWLPPTFDGNCLITNYILEKKRLDIDDWEVAATDIDSTAHVLEDMIPGVAYVFRVAAVNEVGTSPYSGASQPMIISHDQPYDSDSTGVEEVELKTTPFEFEYEMGQLISRGEFGDLCKCQEVTTDREFITKVITTETAEQKTRAMQEFEMHRQLSHPRVTKLEDAFSNDNQLLLVMEYSECESLYHYLSVHHQLDEALASRYVLKVMEGLQYLHDSRIIHASLSPKSILLTSDHKQLKLTDFSLARYIETGNQLQELRGSVEYMAPEAVSLLPLTTAADIWSAGAIAYFMVTGHSPFVGPNNEATIANITAINLDKTYEQFQDLSLDCQDFIAERTIVRNPRRRLTAQQCQRHRWLQSSSSQLRRFSADRPPEIYRRRGSTDSPLIKLKRFSLDPEIGSMSQ